MLLVPRSTDIRLDGVSLEGFIVLPDRARAIILFAHGSGSSRHSPRNAFVARVLNRAGFATLLFDLLTPLEDARGPSGPRFDIDLLAERLVGATDWLVAGPQTRGLRVGYFGASTGAAAALVAAAERPNAVGAVVCRGGRPDLARDCLGQVEAPTRLVVGGLDTEVLELNRWAEARLRYCDLVVVPGATHLFEERGALPQVAQHARFWFERYLPAALPQSALSATPAYRRSISESLQPEGVHAHAAS
jgi:putative phosphoribosyl transferase